jgi:hypothetical protein
MPRKRPPATLSIGVAGLKQSGGKIQEEWHPNLRGAKAAKVYEEMRDNDAIVGAVLYTIESYLRKMEWEVEPADDSEAALKEAEFLESCMSDMDMPWQDFISDVLSFLVYGHSLHEEVLKIRVGPGETNPRYRSNSDDHRIGWRALALRPQSTIDRWDIDPVTGEILGAYQKPPNAYGTAEYYLPIHRCVLFRTRPYKNNPEGRSILRNAYRAWYLKKKLEEIEAVGLARDLNGFPVFEAPPQIMSPNASAAHRATRAALEEAVSKIHRDELEGLVIPSSLEPGESNVATGYKFSLMSTMGGKQASADPIIRRYDARIAMSMASEFLILGTEKQGSFALGAEKSANFLRSLYWYGNTIAATLNNTAIRRLYEVNNVPVELRAKICPGGLESPDLLGMSQFLTAVTSGGLLHPTPAVEERIREIAGLPEESEELERLFAEAKALEEEQRQLDAEVARAGMEATAAAAKAPPDGGKAPVMGAKPGAKPVAGAKPKPGAKPAPKGK